MTISVLLVDNYDSFTWNLVQYFWELEALVEVRRNDQITVDEIIELGPDMICLSPGPSTPNQAGISLELVARLGGKVPIFGVCLGMQTIGQVMGGVVVRAPFVVHGKTSLIHHDSSGVFKGLPDPYVATRYHSLIVDAESLPSSLKVSAWIESDTEEHGIIMGIRHRQHLIEGVQFHPESVLTEHGHQLLKNFMDQVAKPSERSSW